MATDKSEPRIGLIIKVGALAVFTLIAVHAALSTYFDRMAQGEEFRKIGSAKPETLMSVRADEKQRLGSGPMPIDKAMHDLALHGRTGTSPELMPKPSMDTAPLQGWIQMPGEVPAPMLAASSQSAQPAPSASAAADGGAAPASGDAGARDSAAPKRPIPQPPSPKP